MRILHVASEYPPARIYGLGRFVHGLARAQARAGHEVFVLTNSHGGEEDGVDLEGVHVHRIAFPNPPRPADGHGEVLQFNHGAVARFLDRRSIFEKVQVVASHDWLTALAAREMARELDVPLVATFHDEVIGKRFGVLGTDDLLVRDLEALTAHDSSRVIANSRFIAEQVVRHYGVPEERVVAIPGGIDPTLLAVPDEALVREFRSGLVADDELLVLYAGRMDPEKGMPTLIEAVLEAARARPKLRFVFAGSGREEHVLSKSLASLGDRARLVGYAKGEVLACLYRAADVVVVPSIYEPFGLVAVEALLAGTAVIASDTGGLSEIVRHEVDGLTVPPGDGLALARALVRLADDEPLRKRLGASGRERARRDFDWDEVGRRTVGAYLHAIADRRTLAGSLADPPTRPLVSVTIVTHNAPAHVSVRTIFFIDPADGRTLPCSYPVDR